MNAELYTFVKDSLESGLDRPSISQVLLQARWPEAEIKGALEAFAEVDFPVPVPRPRPNLQAQEAFLYLVSFIALYTTAFFFGSLIFGFIEQAFPDALSYGRGPSRSSLSTPLAAVIVAFPLYLFFMWRISKSVAESPDRRQSPVRKWLTYLTLVVGAGILIGDVIALLASFLQGELSIRFALKGLTILAVTGSIFGYYLWDLRRGEEEEKI